LCLNLRAQEEDIRPKIKIDKRTLISAYETHGSLNKAGKVLGVSSKTIKNKLSKINFKWKPKPKYVCDQAAFDQLNKNSLYWLGFIATDGNIYKAGNSFKLKIELSTKDANHLIKFKEFIKSDTKIYHYVKINNFKYKTLKKEKYSSSAIVITSKHLFDKLVLYNITPNKTFTFSIPATILNHLELSHFLRGMFDGNGWINHHYDINKRLTGIRIGLCGANEAVPTVFQLLKDKLGLDQNSGYFEKIENTYRFEFSAHHDVDKIVDFLYKDAEYYLDRKYKIAKEVKAIAENSYRVHIPKETFVELYSELGSMTAVSKHLEIDRDTCKRNFVKYGIEYAMSKVSNTYNSEYFAQENECEEQLYWAGFIAGKSTIDKSKNRICVRDIDRSHLEKFMHMSGIEMGINQDGNSFRAALSHKPTLDILEERFNINEDKEMNYKFPEWLVKHPLFKHFLRGYLDAKSALANHNNKILLTIVNSQENLVIIKDTLEKQANIQITAKITPNVAKTQYKIIIMRNQAKTVLKYLYQEATIYLPRKYDIVKDF